MSTSHQIAFVRRGSPAALAGVEPMDIIKEINGVELIDIFDYYYYEDEPAFDMLIEKPDQARHLVHITKSEGEDLGITFENGLMDDYRSCHNKCMFFWIDQILPGMRESL